MLGTFTQTPLFAGLLSFSICLMALPWLMLAARRIGLLDKPDYRKKHQIPTPLVGGVAIYLAIVLSSLYLGNGSVSLSLLGWIGVVLVIGVLDDRYEVSYLIRILFHMIVVLGIWSTDGLLISSIGTIISGKEIVFPGYFALAFTVLAVVGAVNAVNMADGVDGLLGSLCIASLTVICAYMTIARVSADAITVTGICILIGSLTGFLAVNSRFFGLKNAKVFLGDAGSTVLGFLVVYLLVAFSQGQGALFSPVVAGWILGMPLLDASAVIASRVLEGRAPFYPDRKHLHHLLMDSGVGVNRTVGVILSAHVVLLTVGIGSHRIYGASADAFLFWVFVALVVARVAYGSVHSKSQSELAAHHSADLVKGRTTDLAGSVAVGVGLSDDPRDGVATETVVRDIKEANKTAAS